MENKTRLDIKVPGSVDESQHLFPNYLSSLSHDIRTPLSAIIGFSDLLAEPRVSRADQRNYCLMIGRSSRKLLDLMSNLIDLAKMETGNLELFYKPVVIKDLIEDIRMEIKELSSLYEKGHIKLEFSGPSDNSATVFADKGRLFQIIKILMDNSLRYTKDGSISLKVSQPSASFCNIEVADTGCGMDAETLDHLFDQFPTPGQPIGRKMKSRGMSMTVVKRLCDLMDIVIEVNSHVGIGTLIRLKLPCRTL